MVLIVFLAQATAHRCVQFLYIAAPLHYSSFTLQVLSIGETVEEVNDSGFLGTAPTLMVQLLADSGCVQVHPAGLRHIRPDKRVNEWKGKTKDIVMAASNAYQVGHLPLLSPVLLLCEITVVRHWRSRYICLHSASWFCCVCLPDGIVCTTAAWNGFCPAYCPEQH